MKRNNSIWLALLATLLLMLPAEVLGQTSSSITGAGVATLPSEVSFNGRAISRLEFGLGIDIAADGSASGDVQITLVGTSGEGEQRIIVEGKIAGPAVQLFGAATLSGTCSIDLGDGTTPTSGTPLILTVTSLDNGKATLTLVLGLTNLPAATLSEGNLTVK